jgi:HK97 family phage portal protein
MVWWRRKQPKAQPKALVSIGDPALAEWFSVGSPNYAGVPVGEGSALGLSAVWRATSLIAQTIASCTARTMRQADDGTVQPVASFLDDPAGAVSDLTAFEFWETLLAHLLLHGNAYLLHHYTAGGAIAAMTPVHPSMCAVDRPHRIPEQSSLPAYIPGDKVFSVTLDDGRQRTLTGIDLTHIPALSTDGLRGLSPIAVARNSLGTAIAGDRAAARVFANGALHSGMVTPEEDVEKEEAEEIKASLDRKVAGWEHAGEIAVINRKLKFTPWTMSLEDAQFLQSRQFSVEEVARWFGLPSFALNLEQKSTSWGSGIESMQRGLARQVLGPWATRIEQRLSRLVPRPRFLRFDFSEIERAAPEQETAQLATKVREGLITPNEARKVLGLPPIAGGDVLRATAVPASVAAAVTA